MAQKIYTATLTNGSQNVTIATDVTAYITTGNIMLRSGEGVPYFVSATPTYSAPNTTVVLTGNYAGTSGSATVAFGRDFLTLATTESVPLLYSGDIETGGIFTRAMTVITSVINALIAGTKSFTAISITGGSAALTGASSVTVNSAAAALTVTQTGTGNALVVEDSTSPDSTPFVVDGSGYIISGATTVANVGASTVNPPRLSLYGTSGGNGCDVAQVNSSSSTSVCAELRHAKSLAGAAVSSGTQLGKYSIYGHDGTAYIEAANISTYADAVTGTNDMPGRMVVALTADGASSPTARWEWKNDGTSRPVTDNSISFGDGTHRPTVLYAVSGTINTSDAREKTILDQAVPGLAFINDLVPVTFKWKVGQNIVTKVPDGTEWVEEPVYETQTETVNDVNVVDGVAVITPRQQTKQVPVFDLLPMVDEAGNALLDDKGDQLLYRKRRMQLVERPVWRDEITPRPGARPHWGLIAQQVKAVMDAHGIADFAGWTMDDPANPNSRQGLRYEQFVPALITAVQELSARVAVLETGAVQ